MPPRATPPQSKYWCFTDNHPATNQLDFPDTVQYAAWQLEDEGTPHLQGYIEFKTKRTLAYCKTLIQDTTHWEVRKGSFDQANDYAQKEGRVDGPWFFGEHIAGQQGKRNDLREAMSAMVSGKSAIEMMEEHPAVVARYPGFLQNYKRLKMPPAVRSGLRVSVYWGATGTGKSRRAFEENPGAYRKPPGSKWFDGYAGQDVVIWDDFESSGVDFRWFLNITDIYPVQVQVKCSHADLECTHFIFTSNIHPDSWFPEIDTADKAPLRRRITEVVEFFEGGRQVVGHAGERIEAAAARAAAVAGVAPLDVAGRRAAIPFM